MTATLVLSSSSLAQLRGLCSITSVKRERRPEFSRVTAEFADLSHATEVLPRIATGLRVLEPTELREALSKLGKQLVEASEV